MSGAMGGEQGTELEGSGFLPGPAGNLQVEVDRPLAAAAPPRVVVICHPHPQFGGLQQFVWAVDLDSAGRVIQVRQVRTAQNFARVRIGIDTEADVRREFGAPRLVVPFPRTGLVGWMFPYLENDLWNSEMAIYFDAQGIVRKLENGPDPRFLGGGNDRH